MVPAIRIAPRARSRVQSLLRTVQFSHQQCPCHSSPAPIPPSSSSTTSNTLHSSRSHASGIDPSRQKEYAFEMSSSAIRFGRGCTAEVGMDFANMKAKKVLVVTDKTVQKLDGMKVVLEALDREGIAFDVYSDVMVEPKDTS